MRSDVMFSHQFLVEIAVGTHLMLGYNTNSKMFYVKKVIRTEKNRTKKGLEKYSQRYSYNKLVIGFAKV